MSVLALAVFLCGKEYFITYYFFFIVIFFEIPMWPIIFKWVKNRYGILFNNNIIPIFYAKGNQFKQEEYIDGMFRLLTYKNLFIFTCVNIIIQLLICYLVVDNKIVGFDELQRSKVKLYLLYVLIILIGSITARAVVVLYNGFQQLKHLAKEHSIRLDYYENGYKYYNQIKNFAFRMLIIIVIVCVSLVICVLYSPIVRNENLDIINDSNIIVVIFSVLCIIAVMPTVLSIAVYYYLNEIKSKMKDQDILKRYEGAIKRKKGNLNELAKNIEYRDSLLKKNIGESKDFAKVSLFGTIVIGIAQILIIINGYIYY